MTVCELIDFLSKVKGDCEVMTVDDNNSDLITINCFEHDSKKDVVVLY